MTGIGPGSTSSTGYTPATRGSAAPGAPRSTKPASEEEAGGSEASQATTGEAPTRPSITIRWRRYGKTGGRWRADLPPGHGLDFGWIESGDLSTVRHLSALIAARRGWTITEENTDA